MNVRNVCGHILSASEHLKSYSTNTWAQWPMYNVKQLHIKPEDRERIVDMRPASRTLTPCWRLTGHVSCMWRESHPAFGLGGQQIRHNCSYNNKQHIPPPVIHHWGQDYCTSITFVLAVTKLTTECIPLYVVCVLYMLPVHAGLAAAAAGLIALQEEDVDCINS